MPGTKITQVRQPVVVDTGTQYQVSATCTLAGILPDTKLFVRQILDFEDPKNDTFSRVATPDDFTTTLTDREAAINAGASEYRADSFLQNYVGVSEANGAWQELSALVNTLVTNYDTYITVFLTGPEGAVTEYPAADQSTKTALINAYLATLPVVDAAEAARDTENVACEAIQLELRTLQAQLRDAQQDTAALVPIVSNLAGASQGVVAVSVAVNGSMTTLRSQIAASAASGPEKSAMTATTNTVSAQLTALDQISLNLDTNVYSPLSGLLATFQARVVSLQDDVTAAQLEANDCALTMAQLQAAVDIARQERDAALASVRTICPDYIPS